MTKVKINIDKTNNVFFDVYQHAGSKDVCIMASTVCNMVIVACRKRNIRPQTDEDGHLTYSIEYASDSLIEVITDAEEVFREIEHQFPDDLKVY